MSTTKPKRYEVIKQKLYTLQNYAQFEAQYAKLLALTDAGGNSGSWDDAKQEGKIWSFAESIVQLKQQGFTRIDFCNGGDDDELVVDHELKQFATFEDYIPERLRTNPRYNKQNLEQLQEEQIQLELTRRGLDI